MKSGDHIYVSRGAYTHHGILVAPDSVIHFIKEAGRDAYIGKSSLARFADGGEVLVRHYDHAFGAVQVVERAMQKLYQREYSVWLNNCEHFAHWCKTGNHLSKQVDEAEDVVAKGVAATIVATAGTVLISGAALAARWAWKNLVRR